MPRLEYVSESLIRDTRLQPERSDRPASQADEARSRYSKQSYVGLRYRRSFGIASAHRDRPLLLRGVPRGVAGGLGDWGGRGARLPLDVDPVGGGFGARPLLADPGRAVDFRRRRRIRLPVSYPLAVRCGRSAGWPRSKSCFAILPERIAYRPIRRASSSCVVPDL